LLGQRIGYIRVSTYDQNTDRQLDGLNLDRIFTDKDSGKNTKRKQLEELISFVRTGDIVIIHSMDRLARNLNDLLNIVKTLTDKDVKVEFVKESLSFDGEDSPMSTLMLSIMGAFAQFERALILDRQREGIAIAKKKGVYRGRKRALSDGDIQIIKSRVSKGEKKAQLAREFGVSRETLYQYLRIETKNS